MEGRAFAARGYIAGRAITGGEAAVYIARRVIFHARERVGMPWYEAGAADAAGRGDPRRGKSNEATRGAGERGPPPAPRRGSLSVLSYKMT